MGLPDRLERAKYLLTFSGWSVRYFNCVVQAFVRPMVSVGCQQPGRLDVAAQLVRDDNAGAAKPGDQSGPKIVLQPSHSDAAAQECRAHAPHIGLAQDKLVEGDIP